MYVRVGCADGRVVEEAVLVEIPRVEIVSPASGSLEPVPLNVTVSGAAPAVGFAVATADGRPVGAEVADPPHGAAVEVGVEDVPFRAGLHVDGIRRSRGEGEP